MRKTARAWAAVGVLAAAGLALWSAGCGGDDGGGNPQPDPCAIANVHTDLTGPWLTGERFNIRWDGQGAAAVDIDLLKAGALLGNIATGTPNDGFHPWNVDLGASPSAADYAIRVAASDDAACAAQLDGLAFTNTAGCAFSFPFDEIEDDLIAGGAYLLTWDSERTSGRFALELWTKPQTSLLDLVGTIVADGEDTGSYLWDPVDSFNRGTGSDYVLRLYDPEVPGCEAVTPRFTMVDNVICRCFIAGITPNETLALGSVVTLNLDQSGGSGFVTLRLYAGMDPVPQGFIAVDQPVGSFAWTVSRYGYTGTSGAFRIKIIDADDPYCESFSEPFLIN